MNRFNIRNFLLTVGWLSLGQLPIIYAAITAPDRLLAQTNQAHLKIIINSDRDTIQADNGITLREAIALINGDLKVDQLSPQEQTQVQTISADRGSQIEFSLPTGKTKIALTTELPAIKISGVTIDGTTQSGFIPKSTTKTSLLMPIPVVEITPADGVEIPRGISILADNITIKGLSIYGFQVGRNQASQEVPGGDIFISDRLPKQDLTANSSDRDNHLSPKNILIESNFLGIKPDKTTPTMTSDFGVYIFNSQGTTIRNNLIKDHTASGIITAIAANNLLIQENVILGNGTAGMPDAIRLEGEIRNNKIETNLICANDGSGIFLFKPPTGTVEIRNNTIDFNGRRLRRAAIHLMGNDHQVFDNNISNQAGAGVSVSAFAQSDTSSARNVVKSNRFSFLEGLSVDLDTDRNNTVENFQDGDGINPPRNSENRRMETGNMAINAPRFLAPEFLRLNDRVNIDGIADPNTQIELYKVSEDPSGNGPLSRSLTTVVADARGRFGATLPHLQPGEMISAIATDPKYGTSEPARNAIVIDPGTTANNTKPVEIAPTSIPKPECGFAIPAIANADPQPPTPPVEPPALPKIIRLNIPANVHFALDKSNISPTSGEVIQNIAKVLTEYPYIVINLEGHTDPRANSDYNQRLGLRRARSTRDYLVKQGIAPSRITIRSYGKTKLKSRRIDIVDYARDRRVEFFYRDIRGIELEVIEQENDLQLERRRGSRP